MYTITTDKRTNKGIEKPQHDADLLQLISRGPGSAGVWKVSIHYVLRIRIRMDAELMPGSGISVPDPVPAKNERAEK